MAAALFFRAWQDYINRLIFLPHNDKIAMYENFIREEFKMKKAEEKTNVMRVLDIKKVEYVPHNYLSSGAVSGADVAKALGEEAERVFKTLVTVGKSGAHYVFVIPVLKELDLRKAAAAVGEKNIEMIKSKELLPLTGYVHGGCSPIGMKKFFKTAFDESAAKSEKIYFSAGKIGYQVELNFCDVEKVIPFTLAPLTDE